MDIRVLRNFLGVARAQSISQASEDLYITQPTLSRQMRELEQELGVCLFHRGSRSRRMLLTEEGKILKKQAEEILILVEKTENQLKNAGQSMQGDLYIGAAETPAFSWIAKACRRFSKRYPQVRIHLYSANADDVLERMTSGILDFGLLLRRAENGSFEYLTIPAKDRWGLLVSIHAETAALKQIHPDDMKQLPLIIPEPHNASLPFSGWLKQDLDGLHIICRYNLLYNAAWLAADDEGAVLCLEGLVPAVLSDKVRFIPLEPQLTDEIRLMWRSSRMLSQQASAFLNEFENLLEESESQASSDSTDFSAGAPEQKR